MINCILILVYTFFLLGISIAYVEKKYQLLIISSWKEILKKNILYVVFTILIFIGVLVAEANYLYTEDIFQIPVIMRWNTLLVGTYLLAKIDFHEKIIPNQVVVFLLLVRIGFLVYEVIVSFEIWNTALLYPLIGAAIGGAIMGICMLISRNGIGMGDIKLFIVVGAYVGSTTILDVMFYTFLAAAVGGVCLLISRKAKLKDFIPMAPFVFVGVILELLVLIIGG